MEIASKHWPMQKQDKFWDWFKPYIKKIFSQTANEIISIWTSFLEVRLLRYLSF